MQEGGAGVKAGWKREEEGEEGSESSEPFSGSTSQFSGSTKVTGVTFGASDAFGRHLAYIIITMLEGVYRNCRGMNVREKNARKVKTDE